jgi:putative ABC transport system permease protein
VTLLLGALTMGLILSLLAVGVYVSFRIFGFADITTDGSITLGGAVAAVLIAGDVHPLPATVLAVLAGLLAGATTGILHAKCGIQPLLSGILVMTALYSVNLHVMGRSNIPLMAKPTLASGARTLALRLSGSRDSFGFFSWTVPVGDLGTLLATLGLVVIVCATLYFFFQTTLGTTMRATGDSPQMVIASGTDVGNMAILGLALSNGFVALSGALLAQYQGFADVQMGIGMVVWGLASVIIGEVLVGDRRLGTAIAGAVMGSVLFRLLVARALQAGLDPNDLKLVTALFVFAALVTPDLVAKLRSRWAAPTRQGAP